MINKVAHITVVPARPRDAAAFHIYRIGNASAVEVIRTRAAAAAFKAGADHHDLPAPAAGRIYSYGVYAAGIHGSQHGVLSYDLFEQNFVFTAAAVQSFRRTELLHTQLFYTASHYSSHGFEHELVMSAEKSGKLRRAAVGSIYAFALYKSCKGFVELIFAAQSSPVIVGGVCIEPAVTFL